MIGAASRTAVVADRSGMILSLVSRRNTLWVSLNALRNTQTMIASMRTHRAAAPPRISLRLVRRP